MASQSPFTLSWAKAWNRSAVPLVGYSTLYCAIVAWEASTSDRSHSTCAFIRSASGETSAEMESFRLAIVSGMSPAP